MLVYGDAVHRVSTSWRSFRVIRAIRGQLGAYLQNDDYQCIALLQTAV